jgi:hypothetical protein
MIFKGKIGVLRKCVIFNIGDGWWFDWW